MDQARTISPASRPRQRRSSQEVRALILDTARTEFGAHGFEGATTRSIANRAGVLESLIFGNFESKATLFRQAIIEPIIASFSEGVLASAIYPLDQSERRMREFIRPIYLTYRKNKELFHALVKSSGQKSAQFAELLQEYFDKSESRLRLAIGNDQAAFDVQPALSVRLLFGMTISTILLDEWLFPHGEPGDDEMVSALARIMHKAVQQDPAIEP